MFDVFKLADPNHDGTGALSLEEFQKLLAAQDIDLSKRQVKALFRQADTSGGDGSRLTVPFAAFEYMYDRAKLRASFKPGKNKVRNKREYIKSIYDEFKEKHGEAEGITKAGLEEIAKLIELKIRQNDIIHAIKDAKDLGVGSGVLSLGELNGFFEKAKYKDELTKELALLHEAEDFRTNQVFQQKLYESFDSSGKGQMNHEDLRRVMLYLPTVVNTQMDKKTVHMYVVKIQGKGDVVEFKDFEKLFLQFANHKNAKDYVTDFDRSDAPKSMFGALTSVIAFGAGVVMMLFGYQMDVLQLVLAGGVGCMFSIYVGLYTFGCAIRLDCFPEPGLPGEPSNTPGHLAIIFLMLAFAAWIYGVLHLGELEPWLEQLVMLFCFLALLFAACRCAAHLPGVGHYFRNAYEITEKELDLEGYTPRYSSKYLYEEDRLSVSSPKSPSSPKSAKKKRDSSESLRSFSEPRGEPDRFRSSEADRQSLRSSDSARPDVEVGLPGEVQADPASAPTSPKLKSKRDSAKRSSELYLPPTTGASLVSGPAA